MLIICLRPLSGTFPASFDTIQEDDSWISVYPETREANPNLFLSARLMASSGSVGAYAVRSYSQEGAQKLQQFASASSRAWTLSELRNDAGALATRLKAAWREERTEEQIASGSVNKISLLRSMAIGSED